MPLTVGALQQLVELNDEKQDAAHRRLRRDLTEGFNDMGRELERGRGLQTADHEELVLNRGGRDRRKELSGYRVALIAALVAIVPQLITIVIHLVSGQQP